MTNTTIATNHDAERDEEERPTWTLSVIGNDVEQVIPAMQELGWQLRTTSTYSAHFEAAEKPSEAPPQFEDHPGCLAVVTAHVAGDEDVPMLYVWQYGNGIEETWPGPLDQQFRRFVESGYFHLIEGSVVFTGLAPAYLADDYNSVGEWIEDAESEIRTLIGRRLFQFFPRTSNDFALKVATSIFARLLNGDYDECLMPEVGQLTDVEVNWREEGF
jgi:hypothetical protein